ncbi:HAD family hydrolase [Aureispira anguillae]|nr:HAD family hydrolase [Aureispira anguillae]
MKFKNKNKTLLILDLDETLIHGREKPLEKKEDFKVFHFFIYKRPFLKEFLNSVKENFLVAVWSSGSDDYVDEIVKHIFPKNYPLEFVWGRSRCVYRSKRYNEDFGRHTEDYSNPYFYVKPIKKLKKHGFYKNRVLLVDDSPEKCIDNYGNAIYPKEYLGENEDNELLFLLEYLSKLKNIENVREIEKRGWKSGIKINKNSR